MAMRARYIRHTLTLLPLPTLHSGQDRAPASKVSRDPHWGSMPKSAMRILNGGKVQAEYNARKKTAAAAGQPWNNQNGQEYRLTAAQKGKSKARSEQQQNDQDPSAAGPDATASTSTSNSAPIDSSNLKIRPGEKLGDFNRRVEQVMASQVAASARSANRKLKKQRREARDQERARLAEEEEQRPASSKKRRSSNGDDEDDQQQSRNTHSEPSSKDLKRARNEYESRPAAPLDFAKADQRRRVNDVAQAPPRLTKAPRGETKQALARKAKLAAALSGSDDPDQAAKRVLAGGRGGTVTSGQMPEPVQGPGLKRQKDLQEERQRVIKMYRQKRQKDIDAKAAM